LVVFLALSLAFGSLGVAHGPRRILIEAVLEGFFTALFTVQSTTTCQRNHQQRNKCEPHGTSEE
jgi:hypothetical protein